MTSAVSGYKKPAPTLARISLMGTMKSVGAPFNLASWEKEYCVLAMQIGKLANPYIFVRDTL